MAQAGATVVIAGRRPEVLQQAAASIGPRADVVVHDVDRTAEAPALVAEVLRRHGHIDILVNNAGIHLKKRVQDITEEEFLRVLSTHVLGAHALTRACLGDMTARGEGVVINIASMASLFGIPLVTAYSAAKCALVGMTRTMATELGAQGIRVNAIAPGWIDSDMMRKAVDSDPERKRKILGRTPLARFGAASDIGAAAVYLASPAGSFVTGVVLPVDGGASIGF
jgi:gluconate 5-dehydrogenase